jgi:predicted Zn finger-like uncharacterized protein
MSLLTQCPACQTYYRVVPDQLRISDGWVKCGNCSDIFDASAHLIEIDTQASQPDIETRVDVEPDGKVVAPQEDMPAMALELQTGTSSEATLPQTEPLAPSVQVGQVEYQVPASCDIEDEAKQAEPVWAAQQVDPVAQAEIEIEAELEATPYALPQLEFPEDQHASAPEVVEVPQAVRWDDPAPSTPLAMPLAAVEFAADEPVTFLHEDPAPSAWQKPLLRGALALLAFVLLVLLAGQWVYRERDRLAASHPEIKPTLQTACAWLNCEILPMRQIEALVIDSVAFNKVDDDTYKLSFTVKNAGELPLAYPAVELVLTDAEDQPAYRRVLSSTELGTKAAELAGRSDWAVTVALRMDASVATQRVFGYRLLVFYP